MGQFFGQMALGWSLINDPVTLLYIGGGVLLGLFFGVIPGLTAVLAMVLLLPLTYGMNPITGFSLLVGTYIGGITGGLVSAVMLGIPGTPASITTTFDGYPLAKAGQAGRAMGWAVVASFVGGLVSWIALVFLAPQLARVALSFGPFEYTAVVLFGFTIVASLASDVPSKGFLMTMAGLGVAAIGLDPLHGVERLTFGLGALEHGVQMVPLLVGFYVVGRALEESQDVHVRYIVPPGRVRHVVPSLAEIWARRISFLRASAIGTGIGILPGIGAVLANFVAYDQERRASSHPETFGRGEIRGIIASEASNNATIGGALIPMLSLGIPGDVPLVVLMGGFMLHGLQPGPLFFAGHPDIIGGIYASYFVANLAMLLFMLTVGVRFFARIIAIPKVYLIPAILLFGLLGSYNVAYSFTDVWVALAGGVFAYLASRAGYPLVPMVIAVILGPMFEYNLRVALTLSRGSMLPFIQRPWSLAFLLLTLVSLILVVRSRARHDEGTAAAA